jgi:hypothetical protein
MEFTAAGITSIDSSGAVTMLPAYRAMQKHSPAPLVHKIGSRPAGWMLPLSF